MTPFDPSTVVKVVGTTSEALNGKTGTIRKYDATRGRYIVLVEDRPLALKPNNIVKYEQSAAKDVPDLNTKTDVFPGIDGSQASAAGVAEEPASLPPLSKMKQCVVCSERIKADKAVVLPACSHVFCQNCPKHLHGIHSCISCQMADPTVDALKKLVYIQDLRDPPEALLEALLDEFTCARNKEVVESVMTQHKNELQVLGNEKTLEAKKAKEKMRIVKDTLGKGKTQKQLKEALRNSQTYKLAKAELNALDPVYEKKRELLMKRQAASWDCRGVHKTAQELETVLKEKSEAVRNAIEKWYRKASRLCHPDRMGAEHQDTFDALVKAKETLCDDELRPKYLKEMLDVLFQVGQNVLDKSHAVWLGKNQPDFVDQKKPDPGQGAKTVFAIEGSVHGHQPRKPGVSVLREESRLLSIFLPFPTKKTYQFLHYCKVIHVFAEQVDDVEAKEIHIAKISEEELAEAHERFGIEVTLNLPHSGIWDIRWCFTMIMEGVTRNSPRSEDTRVDVMSTKQRRLREFFHGFEALARKRVSAIHSILHKLKASRSISQSETDDLYALLFKAVTKGRDAEYHLKKSMRLCGETSSAALSALQEALEQTNEPLSKLEDTVAFQTRKAGLKSFKAKIHSMLEFGEMGSFLSRVTDEELMEMQGDANRLYQLLIEAKKANSIALVNAFTLDAAVLRSDLFTPKQCETLAKRRDEVEAMVAEEAERARKEAKKQKEAEESRRQLEARASGSGMERGQIVVIHGLKIQTELNQSLAIYMGLGNGDRHIVRLYGGNKDISLRKANFSKWEERGIQLDPGPNESESWNCAHCNILHEGAYADATSCSIYSAPRDQASSAETFPPPAQEKKQQPAQQVSMPQQQDQSGKGSCSFLHTPEELATASNLINGVKIQPSVQVKIEKAPPVPVTPSQACPVSSIDSIAETSVSPGDQLFVFLQTQKACLKCSPEQFLQWLQKDDILSLADLVDAYDDDEYRLQLINNGLKKFKCTTFQKAATAAADAVSFQAPRSTPSLGKDKIPDELICPITHAPFIDPVVAADGCCYERQAIEEWFAKQQSQINDAYEELRITPNSERAKGVIDRGVCSTSGQKLDDLTLVASKNTMILAREYTEARLRN